MSWRLFIQLLILSTWLTLMVDYLMARAAERAHKITREVMDDGK